ncbi:MAG: metallophosphoesterase family protein [Chryseolinea sp.]
MKRFFKPFLILLISGLLILFAGSVNEPDAIDKPIDHKNDTKHNHAHSLSVAMPEKLLFPTKEPDRVILNLTENPETSLAVNWRTDSTVTTGTVQWAVSTPGPEFISTIKNIDASKEYLKVKHEDEPSVTATYFSAMLKGLEPGKKYMYRVGSEGWWSEWYQLRMPKSSEKISFLYFGDAQNDIKSMWSRVIREAYKTMPTVDFMLHAGDLINRHDRDVEWGEWFYAGNFIHATVPSVMTPGNHEYGRGVVLSPQWRKQFNLPLNGPKGLEETCYVVNFKNLKIVSLDAEQIDESVVFRDKQVRWLDSVLTNDHRQWTAVTLHFPLFSTNPKRDNPELRKALKPIFDKHRVDVVLQGHDHAYGRGIVSNEDVGATVKTAQGTVYVVSVSGPKMYEVSNDPWMQRKGRNTQLFQLITIDKNVLKYQAYSADGVLYDAFDLIKSGNKPNKFVERVPDIAERK